MDNKQEPSYIYTYACTKDEIDLCDLEFRSLLGVTTHSKMIKSTIGVDPSRSPFLKERIEVLYEGDSLASILEQVEQIELLDQTFQLIYIPNQDLPPSKKVPLHERQSIERDIGMQIEGEPDYKNPDRQYGITVIDDRWYFGNYMKGTAHWFHHMQKPRSYSIALPTRLARAAVNIAVPQPMNQKVIDPCCGIGTVLIEALSMGINIVGRDMNPYIVRGAQENLEHFGYDIQVELGAIANVTELYDAAIIDMPYNLYSNISSEEQLSIVQHARRIANRVIVITIDTIDSMITDAGLTITDRCLAKKGNFSRQILVCE
ncbi:DNA methyltransferase [Paenibacillus sp. N1-5-1-14]|uniref:TRM11 family SAM-dependent methyltransferase n=1 Tax=Paenibacillus radicibacter TaxID=2972488 RepID=UPI00215932EA|nr:DNA methyltransferase [Paenibacillus radicibacter]MCR8641172.1 DNA methyltransferase [Paenibacillus radicibacter]